MSALQRNAERRGQSLQQYLVGEPRELARRHSVADVLDDVEAQGRGQAVCTQLWPTSPKIGRHGDQPAYSRRTPTSRCSVIRQGARLRTTLAGSAVDVEIAVRAVASP